MIFSSLTSEKKEEKKDQDGNKAIQSSSQTDSYSMWFSERKQKNNGTIQ